MRPWTAILAEFEREIARINAAKLDIAIRTLSDISAGLVAPGDCASCAAHALREMGKINARLPTGRTRMTKTDDAVRRAAEKWFGREPKNPYDQRRWDRDVGGLVDHLRTELAEELKDSARLDRLLKRGVQVANGFWKGTGEVKYITVHSRADIYKVLGEEPDENA